MNPAHKTPGTVMLLLALLGTSCSRDAPVRAAADGDSNVAMAVSRTPQAALPVSPTNVAGTSHVAAPPSTPRPATALLARPEIVLATYLGDRAPDGSPNPLTTGRAHHATFVAEQRDVAWADDVEPQLRDYFERQRRRSIVVPFSVECRSTMCEVLAVSRTPQSASGEVDRWHDIVFGMHREPWYASARIRGPSIESGVTEDGRAAILIHLMRE